VRDSGGPQKRLCPCNDIHQEEAGWVRAEGTHLPRRGHASAPSDACPLHGLRPVRCPRAPSAGLL